MELPAPETSAPALHKNAAKSTISGSLAALEIDRHPVGTAGRQHSVFSRPYTGDGQDDLPSPEVVAPAVEVAALALHLSAHSGQCRQVQVDGSGAQLTAAGHGQFRLPHPAQDGPQEHHGRAHLPHELVGYVPAVHGAGIHRDGLPVLHDHAAQVAQDGHGSVYIGQLGAVM